MILSSRKNGRNKLLALVLVFLILYSTMIQVFARLDGPEPAPAATQKVKQQREESLKLLDSVRSSVKTRRTRLEREAEKEGNDYMSSHRIHVRQMQDQIEVRRHALLRKVESWSQSDKETILALSTDEINDVLSEATGIADYYGLDTVELTKLYDIGKTTIKRSLFELPENTHPDDDYGYERLKENVYNSTVDALKPTVVKSFETLFLGYFTNAEKREIEIAEFLAKKQEYRVLLFKRVTLAYLRALLLSGEPLPACAINAPPEMVTFKGEKIPVLNCPDPSITHLRKYVDAIRELQSAEADNFNNQAQMVITQQQLAVDMASVIPVVGDIIDWYGLVYGLYAHEDFTGHCLSYTDYAIQFFAAVVPFAGPKVLESAVARSPAAARFVVNVGEIFDGVNQMSSFDNLYHGGGNALSALASSAGSAISPKEGNRLLVNLADRWGVTPQQLETFSRDIQAVLKKSERQQKQAAEKILREAEEKAAKESKKKLAEIMAETIDDANMETRALKKLQHEAPEIYERALREAEEVFSRNLKTLQKSQADAIANSNMVDEHVEEIMHYMKEAAQGKHGPDAEKMVLIYRHVNADSKELIRQGFFTKGMDVKGKSADWGAHRGFIPIEQQFSKLGNPNKLQAGKLSPADAANIDKFQKKVSDFISKEPGNAAKYSVDLVVEGTPVMVVKDTRTGKEITTFLAADGRYLDEARNPFPVGVIDDSSKRPLRVMGTPDDTGKVHALTADYDFLAFGFSSEVGNPNYDDLTGYISQKQETVLDDINQAIQRKTGYKGNVSHHGPEVQYPDSPGAFQDPLLTTMDLEYGVMTIPKCDADCMRKWCSGNSRCTQFGFPTVPVCNMNMIQKPCIAVDPDRLLKDYMHLKRLQNYKLFPNKSWGWGDYNVVGGWNMVNFLNTPPAPGIFERTTRISRLGTGELIRAAAVTAQERVYATLLEGLKTISECPFGKSESDYIEATP